MGLLDGILGGIVGAEMVTVVNRVITEHGGVSGIVDQFHKQGLGPTISSWVGTGANQPISSDQISHALGPDLINTIATKVGMTPDELSSKLSTVLPGVIDKLTPNGVVPAN